MACCDDCAKRRPGAGLTVRLVDERRGLLYSVAQGFAVGIGTIGAVMILKAIKPPKEIPV